LLSLAGDSLNWWETFSNNNGEGYSRLCSVAKLIHFAMVVVVVVV